MTDTVIPITANPAQTMNVILNNQNCVINLYQKNGSLYFDLYSSNNPLIIARLCLDRTQLIFEKYLNFTGQLFFVDMQGTKNPTYDLLGTRYILFYRI